MRAFPCRRGRPAAPAPEVLAYGEIASLSRLCTIRPRWHEQQAEAASMQEA